MNIHLLALFNTEDVKKYGFNAILEPLINDLKILECTGVEVPFSNGPVCGTIAPVTGDNLGLHSGRATGGTRTEGHGLRGRLVVQRFRGPEIFR